MKEIIVSKDESNQRADKYLLKYFNKSSKSFLYKMLRKKRIKLNKKRIIGNEIIKANDVFQIYLSIETIQKFSNHSISKHVSITHKVIYEDDNILICNKPVGLLSQPNNRDSVSLVDEIITYLVNKGEYNPEVTRGFRPGICNRLDRNTSGIVIAGKNIKSLQEINRLISNNKLDKHYMCIVKGILSTTNTIEGYLTKDGINNKVFISDNEDMGTYIKTIYKPLKIGKEYTLLDVKIVTGKSHQIRAHLSSIGHPLIGDYKYGDKKINDIFKDRYGLKHQLLHAYKIRFNTDNDGYLLYLDNKEFITDIHGRFKKIADTLFSH
ncbi:RluA family pseudouridine synthase [Vallitalea sp.]|jgi:23S rRNA pseudouridine955/2504/2580 synthase|uniref:RluA family pseudouridine synthase n=1 Tax=Vallitalea sp. TaxID=1882829 RepID=UPI0025D343C7|nr:RluA family pseudouridine synthase [Vallitalea sp.]MCT4688288.1 RluA family pseudouridine synthase [Vallitalea sp.]